MEGKKSRFLLSTLFLLSAPSWLSALSQSLLSTILLAYQGRPAIRRLFLGPETPVSGCVPTLAPAPAPIAPPNNDFIQEFMQTFIEMAQAPAALAARDKKARDNTNRLLKPQNPDLYYDNLYIVWHHFYQQYKNHFEIAGSLGHKYVLFTTRFLKDRILNRWQQYNTWMQRNWLTPMT